MLCQIGHTKPSSQASGEYTRVQVITSVKMARMKTLSFQSCHVWKLYRASGRAQSKGGLFQKGKRRGVLSHLWFNGFSGARVWVTIPEQAKMLRHPHYSWTALWTPWENMCDAGIILLIKRDLNLEHCSRMFPGRQKRKNPAALPITNNLDLSLLHQDSR